MPKKQIILLAVLLAVLIQSAVVYRFYYKKNISGRGIACTQEAKLCPDGSSVGRIGPNCEFAECPVGEMAGWQTYRNEEYGFEFQHPGDWINQSGVGLPKDLIKFIKSKYAGEGRTLSEGIILYVSSIITDKSLEELAKEEEKKTLDDTFGGEFDKKQINFQKEAISVGGYNGYRISSYSTYGSQINNKGRNYRIIIKIEDKTYNITTIAVGNKLADYLDEIDRVLSTFKFIK